LQKAGLLLALLEMASSASYAQLGGLPGSFSRMGFGARGMAMGNAMTAVSTSEVLSYYNPALPAFSQRRTASATYTFLSLDRRLGFLSYTQAIPPTAGISGGIIYAGVTDIDGRDLHGVHTNDFSTSEFQFSFSFSNKFADILAIGVGGKFYYYRLFERTTTTTVGLDVGVLYKVTPAISVGAAIQEINAKYRWDTSSLYGRSGNVTTEAFPVLKRIGVAYQLPHGRGTIAIDLENSTRGTTILRAGGEIMATEYLTVRGGVDRVQLSENENGVKPSLGFTLARAVNELNPSLSYAYVFEPFSSSGMSVLTLSVGF